MQSRSSGHPEAVNRHLPLGGPEAVSWLDVVTAFERSLGRKIPVVSLAPGESLPGAPEIIGHFMPGLEMYVSVIEMAETAKTFGVRQTRLGQLLHLSARTRCGWSLRFQVSCLTLLFRRTNCSGPVDFLPRIFAVVAALRPPVMPFGD